jgi:hypothetical protein
MTTEYKRIRLRQELLGLFSHSVLSHRPTELFREAIVEGDIERARMIAEVAPGFFPDQAQELAELAKTHLPDKSGPGFREGTWAEGMTEFFEAR